MLKLLVHVLCILATIINFHHYLLCYYSELIAERMQRDHSEECQRSICIKITITKCSERVSPVQDLIDFKYLDLP